MKKFYFLGLLCCISFFSSIAQQHFPVKHPRLMEPSEQRRSGVRQKILAERGTWDPYIPKKSYGGSRLLQSREGSSMYYYVIEAEQLTGGNIHGRGKIIRTSDKEFANQLYKSTAVFDYNRIIQEVEKMDSRIIYACYGRFSFGSLLNGTYRDKKTRFDGYFNDLGFVSFGKLSSPLHDTVYTGFIDEMLATKSKEFRNYGSIGLRVKSYADTMEIIQFMKSKPYEKFKPYPASDYDPKRKYQMNLPWNYGIYEGEAVNGVPEGLGFWRHESDGSAEIGYFKRGFPHGVLARLTVLPGGRFGRAVIGIGLFREGRVISATSYSRGYYEGEVNSSFLPNGKGKMWDILVGGEFETEEGTFLNGQLHGYGKRTQASGSFQSGMFTNGVFTSGQTLITHRGLYFGDVIRVNGKKFMVVETNRSDASGKYYVVLNDGSKLFESQPFTLTSESDSEFYFPCSNCSGSGSLTSQYQTYSWLGNDYSESVKTDQNYGTATKTMTITPKYVIKNHTRSATCTLCNGGGRLLKPYPKF